MKRHLLPLLSLLVTAVLMFTGCLAENVMDMAEDGMESLKSSGNEATSGSIMYVASGEHEKELLAEIIECFNNRDKKRLKSFFNDYYRDSPMMDADIEEAFDFVDGKIIAYGKIFGDGSTSWDYYEVRYRSYNANVYVITDKGKEYKFLLAGELEDAEDPKEVGVCVIEIRSENEVWRDMSGNWRKDWRRHKEFVFILGSTKDAP